MRQGIILLTLILAASMLPLAQAQIDVTPQSLTLTIYTNGVTQVDYLVKCDPTKVRVYADLIGENINNLVVRNEDGNPLGVTFTNQTARVDSIGALELYFSYQTEDLTNVESSVWVVNVTTPINVTLILPEAASIFDMKNIPIDAGMMGALPYYVFPGGNNFVYYILGMPAIEEEANASYVQAQTYINQKTGEGYILTAAEELLQESSTYFAVDNYLDAKQSADDALLVAADLVEYANDALSALDSAEASINSAIQQERTIGLDEAQSMFDLAQTQYSEGLYRNAELNANQAAEQADQAKKPNRDYTIFYALFLFVLMVVIWFKRDALGF